jgi:hypothetical protein
MDYSSILSGQAEARVVFLQKIIRNMDRIEIMNTINEALAEEFEIDISMLVPDANIIDALDIDSL